MKKNNFKVLVILHLLLSVYSLNTLLSKYASQEDFLSLKWCLCYGGVIFFLGIYAIGWQQIIKKMPLTSAYANRAVTVIWGVIWGVLFFNEKINAISVIGMVLIISGVVLFAFSDSSASDENISETEDKKCNF